MQLQLLDQHCSSLLFLYRSIYHILPFLENIAIFLRFFPSKSSKIYFHFEKEKKKKYLIFNRRERIRSGVIDKNLKYIVYRDNNNICFLWRKEISLSGNRKIKSLFLGLQQPMIERR